MAYRTQDTAEGIPYFEKLKGEIVMEKQDKNILDMKWIFIINNTLEENMKEKINYIHSWNTTQDSLQSIREEGALAKVKAYHFNTKLDIENSSPMDHMDTYMIYTLFKDRDRDCYSVKVLDREGIEYLIPIPSNFQVAVTEIEQLERDIYRG